MAGKITGPKGAVNEMTIPTPSALPSLPLEHRLNLPAVPGIYFAIGANQDNNAPEVLYVGKAASLRTRWLGNHHRLIQLQNIGSVKLAWLEMASVELLDEAEQVLIQHFAPRLNRTDVIRRPKPESKSWGNPDEIGQSDLDLPFLDTADRISQIGYTFVWCPKRRRKILVGPVESDLRELIQEQSARLDAEVVALEIMPDHVHLFLNCPPSISPNEVMHQLKGSTSRALRLKYSHLARMDSLWTRSYFCSTAGSVSAETVKRYIENQKTR